MAESFEPDEYNDTKKRRRYPWKEYAAEPFKVFRLQQGKDFDVTPYHMAQAVYTYAARKKLEVTLTRTEYPAEVTFCFYHRGEPKPRWGNNRGPLTGAVVGTSEQADSWEDGTYVTCVICDSKQQRIPTLLHVAECLVNSAAPGKVGLYPLHRENAERVPIVGVSWDAERGPYVETAQDPDDSGR